MQKKTEKTSSTAELSCKMSHRACHVRPTRDPANTNCAPTRRPTQESATEHMKRERKSKPQNQRWLHSIPYSIPEQGPTTRPRPRGRQPGIGWEMPSPRPTRPQNSEADRKMPKKHPKTPASCTATSHGPGDAKPTTQSTPEETHNHDDASSGSRKLTHRSNEAEEAAFSNRRVCSGSRELTENLKGRDPGEHEHTSNNLEAIETPGGGQVPALTQRPAPPPYAWGASRSHSPRAMPSICFPPRPPAVCHLVHCPHSCSKSGPGERNCASSSPAETQHDVQGPQDNQDQHCANEETKWSSTLHDRMTQSVSKHEIGVLWRAQTVNIMHVATQPIFNDKLASDTGLGQPLLVLHMLSAQDRLVGLPSPDSRTNPKPLEHCNIRLHVFLRFHQLRHCQRRSVTIHERHLWQWRGLSHLAQTLRKGSLPHKLGLKARPTTMSHQPFSVPHQPEPRSGVSSLATLAPRAGPLPTTHAALSRVICWGCHLKLS